MSFVHVTRSPRGERPARTAGKPRPLFVNLELEGLEARENPSTSLVDYNASVLGAANGQAQVLAVTPDGRYAIFESTATNVIPNEIDIAGTENLYWIDFRS